MIVFEVIEAHAIGDYESLGLFTSRKWARILKRDIEKKKSLNRITADRAGIEDDYGMIKGVYIAPRKVNTKQ